MPTYLVLILATAVVVGLFILGMSLSLLIKGRHMQSEISENPHMRRLGIKCAVRESLDEERELRGTGDCLPLSCGTSSDCSSCGTE